MSKKTVVVGMVGGGYASTLHGNGYNRVSGVDVRLKTIVDLDVEKAQKIADIYGIESVTDNFDDLLADEEIDVIDIVTPPALHEDMIIKAMKAGKHVICEKPLSGYFGEEGDVAPIGKNVAKSKMYASVLESMDKIKEVVDESQGKFMYAENYVYCTPVQKSAELIRAKKSKILCKGRGKFERFKLASCRKMGYDWWRYCNKGCLPSSFRNIVVEATGGYSQR